jgi:hypothetical protein
MSGNQMAYNNKETMGFETHKADKGLNDYLFMKVNEDFDSISIPKDVKQVMKKLMALRETKLKSTYLDKIHAPELISLQGEVMENKYLVARHLSIMKGSQSYAFIFRKFMAADEYSKAKDRLGKDATKVRVGEIESEVEKKILSARKSEVAFQVTCDRVNLLLEWCDDIIMNLQNRIRQESNDQRQQYASSPGRGQAVC